jgi:hypothetical protein
MDEAGDGFVPSAGPWELLDEAGLFHLVPDATKINELAAAKDLHRANLRKLVGLDRGNLKSGSHAEHSEHWTVLPHGVKYIIRDGLDAPVAIIDAARSAEQHTIAAHASNLPASTLLLLLFTLDAIAAVLAVSSALHLGTDIISLLVLTASACASAAKKYSCGRHPVAVLCSGADDSWRCGQGSSP